MTQEKDVTVLDIPLPEPDELDEDLRKYFEVCREKLGLIPNVLRAYSFDQNKLRTFSAFYNELMLEDSGLSKLEREMIAVVVSSANHCYYCLTAHGAAVRKLSGDAKLGESLVMNYRAAKLEPRQRAMLDFAHKLTVSSDAVVEEDRQHLRDVGFSERDIWDIASVAALFNMTNRVASAVEMVPNDEYHGMGR